MLAKRCAVLIKKGMTTNSPKVVWEHDIPVMQYKFGAANIARTQLPRYVVIDPKKMPVERGFQRWPIEEVDHDEEFNRLNMTYGKHEDTGNICVEMAYGLLQESKMSGLNESRYRPMVELGHSYIKPPVIPQEEYNDGLTVFEPEDEEFQKLLKAKENDVPEVATAKEGVTAEDLETPEKPYSRPLIDEETMYKIENLTKEGIEAMLTDRDVPFDQSSNKEVLHALFMDSMKPVGVDPETEE